MIPFCLHHKYHTKNVFFNKKFITDHIQKALHQIDPLNLLQNLQAEQEVETLRVIIFVAPKENCQQNKYQLFLYFL